jgi:hypothetical protein
MQTTVIPLTSFEGRRVAVAEGWKAKYGGLEVSEAKRLRQL